MRFLTYSECAEWCSDRSFPTRPLEGYIDGPHPDVNRRTSTLWNLDRPRIPDKRSGWHDFSIHCCGRLRSCSSGLATGPSSQHMPLFARFREAFGEKRPLIDVPGHLVTSEEADDAISIMSVSLLFTWNCHVLSGSGRDAVFTSHDEFGWFASRDPAAAAIAREKIGGALHANFRCREDIR
jgi:hypothetical protein